MRTHEDFIRQDIAAFFRHLSTGKEILLDQPLANEFDGYRGALEALWVMVVSLLRKGPWMNSDECNGKTEAFIVVCHSTVWLQISDGAFAILPNRDNGEAWW